MEPEGLSEPMVTNEMERIAIDRKSTAEKMECAQKTTNETSDNVIKSKEAEPTEPPPYVPLQLAVPSSPHEKQVSVSPRMEKKSPRQRKRSQPVRGDLIPDPDKLLSYKKQGHKKEEEELEDPTVPGGVKAREPRKPGDESAERKRSTVTFSTVIETIDK